jgi:hypothetical protein
MTAVGALMLDGYPLLVGDVVLSTPGEKPDTFERYAYARKIYRFAPNLVVGWSGDGYQAGRIIRCLKAMPIGPATYEECARILASVRDAPDVTLAGWVVEGAPMRISWRGDSPDELCATSEDVFIGCGANTMRAALRGRGQTNMAGVRAAALHAACSLGDLRFREVLFSKDWDTTVGFAYEALIFDQGQFSWGPPITYVGWTVRMDAHGRVASVDQAPVVTTQRSEGEHLLVQEKSATDAHWRNSVSVAVDEYPLSKATVGSLAEQFSNRAFAPRADCYVNYFVFRQAERWWGVPCAVDAPTANGLMWAEGDAADVRFRLRADLLETVFRDISIGHAFSPARWP